MHSDHRHSIRPLATLRVLDLSVGFAGGFAARLFVDAGAEVVRVELPTPGTSGRGAAPTGPLREGAIDIARIAHLHAGKRRLAIDAAREDERQMLLALAAAADAVIEDRPPGTLDDLAAGYDELTRANRSVVLTSITPFGQDGPYRDYMANDLLCSAMGGRLSSAGILGRPPHRLAPDAMYALAGAGAAGATLSAIWLARRDGLGDHLDWSIVESLLASPDRQLLFWEFSRRDQERLASPRPLQNFACRDGLIAIALNRGIERVGHAIGRPDVAADPRFQTNLSRQEHAGDLEAAITLWTIERTRLEAFEHLQRHGVICAPVNEPIDVLSDPQALHRGCFHTVRSHDTDLRLPARPYRVPGTHPPPPPPLESPEQAAEVLGSLAGRADRSRRSVTGAPDGRFPLAGVRVIDFGDAWAGPYACTLLADAGAEVIRIEDIHRMPANMRGPRTPVSPFEGYLGLDPGDRPWERFFLYNGCERNKFGITLDLKQEPGRELFDRLIVDADILITNYRRRTLASFGIEYERLSALNPRLLMLFISGYGLDGPYADHVALGTTIDAITGHQALNGYPDTTPGETAQTYYPDAATAYHCYFVAQSMLFERERTGRGMFLEVALSEVVYHHLGAHLAAAAASGGTLAVHGNRDPRFAPQGCYPTRSLDPDPDLPNRQTGDRWIAIACETDDQWRRLAQLIGEASLLTDARFDDAASRFTYHDAIDAVISAWTADQDATELMHRLQRSGVPAVAVMPDSDLFADPHIAMRGYLQQHVKRDGAFRGPGPIWRSRRHGRPRVRRPANGLGEHNRQLFQGRLGLTDAEFELLEQCGVCGDRYQLEPVASEVVSGRQGTP